MADSTAPLYLVTRLRLLLPLLLMLCLPAMANAAVAVIGSPDTTMPAIHLSAEEKNTLSISVLR